MLEKQLGNITRAINEAAAKIDAVLNKDEISLLNFDEMKLHMRTELGKELKNLQQVLGNIKFPSSIEISNFPTPSDKAVLSLKVEDIKTLIESVNDLRAIIAQVDFNPTIDVKIPEFPEIKIPEIKLPVFRLPKIFVPEPKVTVNPEIDFSELLDALEPLQFLSDKPTKPIAVRLSDGKQFVKALKKAAGQMVTAFSAGAGMSSDDFKIAFKQVSPNIASTVRSIRKAVAVAGTPVQVTATSMPIKYCLVSVDNEDDEMVIGDANIDIASTACRGCVIYPGAQPVRIDIDNLNKLYVDAMNAGDAISITYFS